MSLQLRLVCLFALAVLVTLVAAVQARDTDFPSRAAGSWQGQGWAKEAPNAPRTAMRCQIQNALKRDGRVLRISGTCVFAESRYRIEGRLNFSGHAGGITGYWKNPRGLGRVAVSGKEISNTVIFAFRTFDWKARAKLVHHSTWTLSGPELKIVGRVKSGEDRAFSKLISISLSRTGL